MVYNSLELTQTDTQHLHLLPRSGYPSPGNEGGLRRGKVHFLDWTCLEDHRGPRHRQKQCWCHCFSMLP